MNDFIYQISNYLNHIVESISAIKVEVALSIGFLISVFATLFLDKKWKNSSFTITIVTLLISLYFLIEQIGEIDLGFFGMVNIDPISIFSRGLILLALLITCIFIQQHFEHKEFQKRKGDLYSIFLAAAVGLNFLTVTTNWLMVFISIEMISICSYILVGYFAENKKQTEAAMKYVLFGSACSAVMLYGLSLMYGFTGTLDFAHPQNQQQLISSPEIMLSISILFIFVGLGFKLSFVPLHLWAPDVYEGAPTPITAFLTTVPKIATIALLARLANSWINTQFFYSELSFLLLVIIAIVTMLVGNLIALRQTEIKRMMAYSAIGNTGFLLMAIVAIPNGHLEIIFFFLTIYTLMNLAAFAFIEVLEQKTGTTLISEYAGLGKSFALLFTCFSIVGISLIGLPPTGGFMGKLLVFTSIFELYQRTDDFWFLILLIVAALSTVISLFYYFKIPLFAFLRNSTQSSLANSPYSKTVYIIGILLTILIVLFGIFPSLILDFLK